MTTDPDIRNCDLRVRPDHRTRATLLQLRFCDVDGVRRDYAFRVSWDALDNSFFENKWDMFLAQLFGAAGRIFRRAERGRSS